ncbi:TA system VapC family ribonuclease toxin [Microbacterium sp.]|uniref:TA system VapC family ribonuclease toxin n=1 Tax=Microbacterium sp. TaxID=51671 RepID=UPI0039E57875
MTATHLIDANVLIALVIEEHEFHQRAQAWVASHPDIALCPMVEGALVRFLVRTGETAATATRILDALRDRCEFWADDVSYADIELRGVIGHRQVTDAYLAALARRRSARLATFDRGLALAHQDAVTLID